MHFYYKRREFELQDLKNKLLKKIEILASRKQIESNLFWRMEEGIGKTEYDDLRGNIGILHDPLFLLILDDGH